MKKDTLTLTAKNAMEAVTALKVLENYITNMYWDSSGMDFKVTVSVGNVFKVVKSTNSKREPF